MAKKTKHIRSCRVCGCTDDDCSQCIEKTGEPCHWVEPDLCSACREKDQIQKALKSLKVLNKAVKQHFQLSDYEV